MEKDLLLKDELGEWLLEIVSIPGKEHSGSDNKRFGTWHQLS